MTHLPTHFPLVLYPFPIDGETEPDLSLTASLTRQGTQLTLVYALARNWATVAIASPCEMPTRQHKLWETTCFELFLGLKDADRYWEFNLSPAGHWNVYRFDSYRQGMEDEAAITALPFAVNSEPDAFSLSLSLDLAPLLANGKELNPVDHPLEAAITAVLQTKMGGLTYWAIKHPGSQPDFHHRAGFLVTL